MANFEGRSLGDILAGAAGRPRRRTYGWDAERGPKPLWAIAGDGAPFGEAGGDAGTDGGDRQAEADPVQVVQAPVQNTGANTGRSEPILVPMDIPGMGTSYFDPAVADRVRDFIDRNQAAGIDVRFASGFRTTSGQEDLQHDPTATTPAKPGNSLHEAGRAFDILLDEDTRAHLDQIVENAEKAGLSWGGAFRSPDPGHFFVEVPEGIGNREPRIRRAQERFRQLYESR